MKNYNAIFVSFVLLLATSACVKEPLEPPSCVASFVSVSLDTTSLSQMKKAYIQAVNKGKHISFVPRYTCQGQILSVDSLLLARFSHWLSSSFVRSIALHRGSVKHTYLGINGHVHANYLVVWQQGDRIARYQIEQFHSDENRWEVLLVGDRMGRKTIIVLERTIRLPLRMKVLRADHAPVVLRMSLF